MYSAGIVANVVYRRCHCRQILVVRDPVSLLREVHRECEWGREKGLLTFEEYIISQYKEEAGQFDYEHGIPYRNPQLFMLGVNPSEFNSRSVVKRALERAMTQFDLVLIHERLLESLVLLRRMLNWEYEDVVSLVYKNEMRANGSDTGDLVRDCNKIVDYYNSGEGNAHYVTTTQVRVLRYDNSGEGGSRYVTTTQVRETRVTLLQLG